MWSRLRVWQNLIGRRFGKRGAYIRARYSLKWLLLGTLTGTTVGVYAAGFLWALERVWKIKDTAGYGFFLLPIGGLVSAVIYHFFGRDSERGTGLALEGMQGSHVRVPFRMAPLISIGTLLSHLCGAGVGKEGAGVQIGAGLGAGMGRLFRLRPGAQNVMLKVGVAAGFSAFLGAPVGATIFTLEAPIIGELNYKTVFPTLVAALSANLMTGKLCAMWGVTRFTLPRFTAVPISATTLLATLAAAVIFGLVAMLFVHALEYFTNMFRRLAPNPIFRQFLGGLIVMLLAFIPATHVYLGLGEEGIYRAFFGESPWYDFLLKGLFTVLCIGAGFKGGEFFPIMFIGSSLGCALSNVLPLPAQLLAGMGVFGLYAGAGNVPLAGLIMSIELLGSGNAVYFALSCFAAYIFTGYRGIYSTQRISALKVDD